jgi:hypothetical protein
MTPTSAAFRWQVDRIERVSYSRRPLSIGETGIGDPHFGLAHRRGDKQLPSPRMLPIPVPTDAKQVPSTCRTCNFTSTPTLAGLRTLADQAERKRKTVVYWP